MKKRWLLMIMVIVSVKVAAQQDKPHYKTIELKPITKQGWSYFYDLNKVSSPSALQIPLISLNDEEINRHYQGYKNLRVVANLVTLAPLLYVLSLSGSQNSGSLNTYWIVFGASLAAYYGLVIWSHEKVGKAVDRYNQLIFQPSQNGLGLSAVYKLR